MNKLEKLKKWAFDNVEILGDDVVKIVDSQIRIWSAQKIKNDNPDQIKEIYGKIKMGFEETRSKAEFVLATALLKQNIKFQCNYPIDKYESPVGEIKARYYLDFLIDDYLNIEVDGEAWHNKEKDGIRDKYLKKMGYKTIRFPSSQVYFDVDSIVDEILIELTKQ